MYAHVQVAIPHMAEAVGDADILIFVLPYKVCSCWFRLA